MGEGLTLISVEKLKRQIDKKGSWMYVSSFFFSLIQKVLFMHTTEILFPLTRLNVKRNI